MNENNHTENQAQIVPEIDMIEKLIKEYGNSAAKAGFSVGGSSAIASGLEALRAIFQMVGEMDGMLQNADAMIEDLKGQIVSLELTIDNIDPDGKQRQALEEADFRSLKAAGKNPEPLPDSKAA